MHGARAMSGRRAGRARASRGRGLNAQIRSRHITSKSRTARLNPIGRSGRRDMGVQTIPEQISQARAAFAEAPDERARMGRISGVLWMFAAVVGDRRHLPARLPAQRDAAGPALAAAVFLYGLASVIGWIPWERASMNSLAIGMVLTIPVAGLAIYLTGGSLSYIEPLLVCPLLYAAFFFPERWAWPLAIELIALRRRAAALRPGRDPQRLPAPLPQPRRRLPRRDLGDGRAEEAAGRRRGPPARLRQPRPADRGRQPPLLRRDDEAGAGAAGAARSAGATPTPARWRC